MTNNIRGLRAHRPWRQILSALLIALLMCPTYGQITQTATITVNVKDSTGEPVPNARVIAKNKDTDESIERMTDSAGVATFLNLPLGKYEVTVEAQNFQRTVWQDVDLTLKREVTLPFELIVGDTKQTRMLTPEGLPVEVPEDRGEQISSLPNLNNDLTPLLQLVPGAVATGSSSLGRIIVDGRGNEQRTLRLDGVDFTSHVEFPSSDSAINPVSSFESPSVAGDLDNSKTRSGAFAYPPMAGPGTGSVSENVTYKGPDSSWKLQLYNEHRNDALNARNFFDYDGKNAIRRNRFGGKFGQAFGKSNRTSLFIAYEGWCGRTERNVYEAIPADASIRGAGGALATYLPGFLPPGTHIVPGAAPFDTDFLVAQRRTRSTANSHAWDLRLDRCSFKPAPGASAACNEATKTLRVITFRLTHQRAENRVPDGVTGRSQHQEFAFTNGMIALRLVRDIKIIPSELDTKPKRQFGHTFRFGFNLTRAQVEMEIPPTTSPDLAQSLIGVGSTVRTVGLPIAPSLPGQFATIPTATLGGLSKSATGRGLDFMPITYNAIYDYSRRIGDAHELYAGFEARFIRFDFDRLGGLTYTFPNVATLRAGTPGSTTFISDLSGTSPFTDGTGRRRARQEFYMGYFQGVSQFLKPGNPNLEPQLTLTYGLRYDYFDRVRERDNRALVIDPLTGETLPEGSAFYRVDKINIQPRFGLAYRLGNETFKNTTLRVGVGLYSGVPRISDLTLPIESERFGIEAKSTAFPILPSDMIRSFIATPLTRQLKPLAFARDFSPLERLLKWDVRFGHTYNGYEFSAYYIGNIGRNLALANIANPIIRVATDPDPTKQAIITRAFDSTHGAQAFGEFPYRLGGGRSSFNALTFQVSRDTSDVKPTPRWLKLPMASFNAKYTLSRSVSNANGTVMSNPFDPDADFGHNSGIARHSFTLSAVYNLWNAAVSSTDEPNNLLRGWKIMPSLKVTSGLPLVIRINRPDVVYVDASGSVFASPAAGRTAVINTSGGGSSGGAAFVPDLLPGANPYTGGFADRLFLDPAAFAIPAPGQFGNLRRGQLRGPGFIQFDLGLRRNLPLGKLINKETVSGEFQVDIFNLFNRANFSNPTAALPGLLGTNATENQHQPGVPITRAAAGTFGYITAADQGRLIQFSVTLRFNNGFTK